MAQITHDPVVTGTDDPAKQISKDEYNRDHVVAEFALPADITPAQLTANTNDWAPTGLAGSAVIRFTTDAIRELTGITGGYDGRVLALMNVGTFPLVLRHDVTSTAANRFLLPGNTDDVIFPGASVALWYDATSSRWRPLAVQVNPIVKALAADHTIASTTATEVTGLGPVTLQPGTYKYEFTLICQTSAIATGIGLGVNFTGTAAVRTILMTFPSTGTTAASGVMDDVGIAAGSMMEHNVQTAFSTTAPNMVNTAGFATANANVPVTIEGILVVTAAGDLELWHSSETAANTSVKAGSGLIVHKLA